MSCHVIAISYTVCHPVYYHSVLLDIYNTTDRTVFLAVLGNHALRRMDSLKTPYRLKGYNIIGQSEALFDHERMNED